ncbi:MAG TPA: SGNH/GDSL hydrolase family protein [Labilithrix sp.]|nr:SGNH/GDSL hydrolase family protein [Labilithrix sp.]
MDFIGRFDTRNPNGPICGWPGCRIVARFDGSSVVARLSEITQSWMTGGPSEWDVAIDGAWRSKIVSVAGAKSYVLATELPRGAHVVELYKRNEAQTGATQFLGYDFGDGQLLPPLARKERKIEIIGDSQAAAFGVEGIEVGPSCPGESYAAKWQNFRKSFGARLGEALDAEVFGTVYSGKGIVKNIWRPDKDTMPVVFGRANPTDATSTWDLTEYVPDAVIVMLGGNDFAVGQPEDDGATSLEEFTDAYDAFVVTLRASYPDAHVFLATSPSVSDTEPPGRQTRTNVSEGIGRVVARRKGAGDERVSAVAPPVALASELTGCDGHGSPEFHERVANDLAPLVRAKLGW